MDGTEVTNFGVEVKELSISHNGESSYLDNGTEVKVQ